MPDIDENSTGTENENGNEGTGSEKETELTPEQLKKELEKVRKEAANTRVKLRETEERLSKAKTTEEFEAARAELANENAKLARELLIERLTKGDPANSVPPIPAELLPLMTGATEEELTAQAELLRKTLPADQKQKTPPANLGGGLKGTKGDDGFDPKEMARLARLGRL